MAECKYVDSSRGVTAGYWCTSLNKHIDWCDRDYCCSESGYQDCPLYNRIPILTEEICKSIIDAVCECVSSVKTTMEQMAAEMSMVMQQCGIESMGQVAYALSNYSFSVPSCRTLYHNGELHLSSEEKLASEMEGEIDSVLMSMSVMPGVATTISGTPVVSSEDFNQLSSIIERGCRIAAEQLMNCSSGSSGSEDVFMRPVAEHIQKCSNSFEDMRCYLMGLSQEAGRLFEQGVISVVSDASSSTGYSLQHANIRWDFDGYI